MIIIPEINTIVLFPPKTGSGSLKKAILDKYDDAIMLYRHMEACGIPRGYECFRKVGIVRNPLDRLWGLYKFLKKLNGPHDAGYIDRMKESVKVPFGNWILNNKEVFTSPYGKDTFYPHYMVNHHLPETMKSQRLTLRPDLGTEIYDFSDIECLAAELDIILPRHHENSTDSTPTPEIEGLVYRHIEHYFQWDLEVTLRHQSKSSNTNLKVA